MIIEDKDVKNVPANTIYFDGVFSIVKPTLNNMSHISINNLIIQWEGTKRIICNIKVINI